jgi:predicted RNase H-like HicB family nuclease
MKQRYVSQDGDMWLGYLAALPDCWTQGESEDDLKAHLLDLYKELESGEIPHIRCVAELDVA